MLTLPQARRRSKARGSTMGSSVIPLRPPSLRSLLFLQASLHTALSFRPISTIKSKRLVHVATNGCNTSPAPGRANLRHRHPNNCHQWSLSRRRTISSTATMMTSTSSATTSTASSILGGDWVGLFATFASKTGDLVPVPEHLIPESMLEWGEIPSR